MVSCEFAERLATTRNWWHSAANGAVFVPVAERGVWWAKTGAVTLIQRFSGALNLNTHFHMLFLDGVYIDPRHGKPVRFRRVKAPTRDELTQLTHTIAHRIGRHLERQGLLERDVGSGYLNTQTVDSADDDSMHHLLGHSITSATAPASPKGADSWCSTSCVPAVVRFAALVHPCTSLPALKTRR